MERDFWNKLRILVTNKCNYLCPFCHNEGQEKGSCAEMMSLADFRTLVDYLNGQDISELHFSGGEPFLNKELVDMILYVNDNTDWGLGCATNLSLISPSQVDALRRTRLKFNIQFPYADAAMFSKSTANGSLGHVKSQIKMVQDAGLKIGLNAVIQGHDIQNIMDLIAFATTNSLPLKLLPEIGLEGSERFKEFVFPILTEYAVNVVDKKTGATRWTINYDGHEGTVLYIDSPCFSKDISTCREFGELRIHPDMSLQPCIMKESHHKLDLSKGKEHALATMTELWNDFRNC